MIIHNYNGAGASLDIPVNDRSYRLRQIMGEDSMYLYFSLPEYIDIKVGAYVDYQGLRYYLHKPDNFKKHHTRNYEHSLTLTGDVGSLVKYKIRDVAEKRLKFPLTAKPQQHLQMLIDNLNARESGWTMGSCIDAGEKLISYNHNNLLEALQMMADAFETEWEVKNKVIHLRKVEYNHDNPLALAYGKGKGFKPGLGRSNVDDKTAIEILHVQGGVRNIDYSKYESKELLLPAGQNYTYEGRVYKASADGLSIQRADKLIVTGVEDSLDLTNIYPQREGAVSLVTVIDAAKHFYDFADSSIPAALDYEACRITGEKMTVVFQTGLLAGREFDIDSYVHSSRTFKIVPAEQDGLMLPDSVFKPAIGDKYAVFGIHLPQAYIRNDATQEGASWDMFKEGVRHLYEHETPRFTFSGELDGIWAKQDWFNIGGKIVLGGYVHFSDDNFLQEGTLIRIVGVKDYLNNPHSPEIDLSNNVVSSAFASQMAKIKQNEVVSEDLHRQSISYAKRRYRDSIETLEMLQAAFRDSFTNAVSPVTVKTMALLVGDESLQFRFVNNMTSPVEVTHVVTYNSSTKILNAPAGIIQHMTLGLSSIAPVHKANEYKFWDVANFNTPPLTDPAKSYYLYIKASKASSSAVFYISENPIGLEAVTGFYHFLMGVLNAEDEDDRSYVSLYGFSEVLPGRVTTNKIVSADGNTFIDLQTGDIQGKFKFTSGRTVEDAIVDQQIYVEYSVNGSTNWHTTFAAGDLYMRQKKGAGNWSAAIRLVGIDGTSGTDGRSVSSMTTEFYLSNSKTSQTGGSWLTEPPTWVNGKYLWTRVKIDYINPASTAYTTPSVSSEWEAVNDLEVGGRNLISNIPDNWAKGYYGSTTGSPVFGGPNHNLLKERISCEPNSYYTMSSPKRMVALQYDVDNVYIPPGIDKGTNETLTFKTHSSARYLRFDILFAWELNELNLISEYKLKLEKGSKATDWTPAPEDVTAEILSAKQEALTAAGNAQSTANSANTAVGNLGNYVDGAFKDGVINAAEAKAIEKYKNTLNEAMGKAESSYLKVYTNTYLSGAPKTALQNAKINLWGQRDTLIGAINTAIAGGTTTASQKLAVDNAFTSFNSLMAAFQNALEEANKAIQVKLDTISKGYVDAIEVGGRNLLPNTSDTPVELSYPTTGWTDDGHPSFGTVAPLTSSKYILSFDAKSTANGDKIECYFYSPNTTTHAVTSQGVVSTANDGYIKITLSNKWERYWILYTQSATTTTKRVVVGRRRAGEGSGTISLKKVMLQEGNKSTDWTPAPEDVPSALTYLATAIQQVQGTTIEGGLVTTNLLMVKDTNKEIRGGMSGLEDNIGFWTGGSYQDALDSLCAILFRKDGTGHVGNGAIRFKSEGIEFGDMNLDEGGAWTIKEDESLKLMISRGYIMNPESIYIGGQSEEGTFGSNFHNGSGEKIEVLASYTIQHDGTQLTIKDCILSTWVQLSAINGYSSSTIQLQAYYPVTGRNVHIETLNLSVSGTTECRTGSKTVNKTVIVPAGYMRLRVVFDNINHVAGVVTGFNTQQTAGTIKIFHNTSNPHSEIGRNGFMFVKNAYNFVWFGVDNSNKFRAILRSTGDFDMPGVLLRGTVESGGGSTSTANWWGPKKGIGVSRTSTGRYVIVHSVEHANYTVTAASRTANRSYHIVSIDNTQFIIEWRTIGSSPTLIDTTFDFTISGQNFLAP